MRENWVQEMRDQSVVTTEHVPGNENLADLFTKCLMGPKFNAIVEKIVNFQRDKILGGHVYLCDLVQVR